MSFGTLLLLAASFISSEAEVEWRGVDFSALSTEDEGGASPPFRLTRHGEHQDALSILSAHGGNAFRMRLWNHPCADGRCKRKKFSYANLKGVLAMAKRCKSANLSFIVDFHYSDWWADPSGQVKPQEWKNLSFEELATAVYDFTRNSLAQLVAQGTPPAAVQVGNEITNGFLFNDPGQPCELGGQLHCATNDTDAMHRFGTLVAQAIRGVRVAAPESEIAIHTDLGNHIQAHGINPVITWYSHLVNELQKQGHGDPPFERIGLSMYPKWCQGKTMDNIAQLAELAAAFPSMKIYLAETAIEASGDQVDPGFEPTPEGQLKYLKAVFAGLKQSLPASQRGGVLWWEGKEKGEKALFDKNWVARPALLKGFMPSDDVVVI